jgi:hypothetical protein
MYQQPIKITKLTRESTREENDDTHAEDMPHVRERHRDDKHHTHAMIQNGR